MTLDDYNAFCASLPATSHVVQWGGAHVWKVGDKVFAIAGWSDREELAVTFKVSDIAYDILREQPGCRPAPYLASRGMNVSIYNLPLCVLSEDIWPFARQSISDWKNVIDEPACLSCAARTDCSGFFLSADQTWRSRAIHPISMKELSHEMA